MLNAFGDLKGFDLVSPDGETVGRVRDLYFDGEDLVVRYLVADIGSWLAARQALLGTAAAGLPDLQRREWPVKLSKAEIEEAPRPDEAAPPVSEQAAAAAGAAEIDWPPLMVGGAGAGYTPLLAERRIRELLGRRPDEPAEGPPRQDPRLRSMAEIEGYEVRATDGPIGRVDDFLVNPLDWSVRYLAVDTGSWLSTHRVVLATGWIAAFDWGERTLAVDVPRHRVETAPEVENISGLQRAEEESLFRHYGKPFDWPS
jgi:uncharacterized protein YrrD